MPAPLIGASVPRVLARIAPLTRARKRKAPDFFAQTLTEIKGSDAGDDPGGRGGFLSVCVDRETRRREGKTKKIGGAGTVSAREGRLCLV